MKNITLAEAYELAVKKWQYIVDNNGKESKLLKAIPELKELGYPYCSYCTMYNSINDGTTCLGCPLLIIDSDDEGCTLDGHPYNNWRENPSKETAQAVLDLIIKTKPV